MNKKYDQYETDPCWAVDVHAPDDEASEELDEAWSTRETESLETWHDENTCLILTSTANLHRLIDHCLDPENGGMIEITLKCGATVSFDIDPR